VPEGFCDALADRVVPRASVRCVPIALDCRMGTLVPCRVIILPGLIREMFVAAEELLDLSLPAAAARLANLARGGPLTRASEAAYGDGLTGLVRVGPLGAAPGMSKLVEVDFLEVVTCGESAVLALRWQATGPGGGLFPALDADMSLTPAGEHSTRLSLAGVYRPPLAGLGAGLDRAVFHKVADATARSLLARVADALARPQEPASAVQGTGTTRDAARRAAAEMPRRVIPGRVVTVSDHTR
jgi:hypothetical protein